MGGALFRLFLDMVDWHPWKVEDGEGALEPLYGSPFISLMLGSFQTSEDKKL